MKMLKNGLEADVFATSRIPIPSPPCMRMGEDDPLCAAPLLEPQTQVHRHHAEVVAEHVAEHVAVVEPVDEVVVLRKQKKRYKNSVLPPIVLVPCVVDVEAQWALDANANAPRPDVPPPPSDHGVVKWGVSGSACL